MVFRAIHARRVWFLLLPLALLFISPYVTSVLLSWFNSMGGNNLPPLPEFYSPSDHRSPDGRWITTPWHKEAYEPEAVIVVSGPTIEQANLTP